MSTPNLPQTPFQLLSPPYRNLVPLRVPAEFIEAGRGLKGSAVIWRLGTGDLDDNMKIARRRPAGVVLILFSHPLPRSRPRPTSCTSSGDVGRRPSFLIMTISSRKT